MAQEAAGGDRAVEVARGRRRHPHQAAARLRHRLGQLVEPGRFAQAWIRIAFIRRSGRCDGGIRLGATAAGSWQRVDEAEHGSGEFARALVGQRHAAFDRRDPSGRQQTAPLGEVRRGERVVGRVNDQHRCVQRADAVLHPVRRDRAMTRLDVAAGLQRIGDERLQQIGRPAG
jgi:hypothetical protein